jgi:hypothetical protein
MPSPAHGGDREHAQHHRHQAGDRLDRPPQGRYPAQGGLEHPDHAADGSRERHQQHADRKLDRLSGPLDDPGRRRPVAQRGLGGLGCLQRCVDVGDQVIGSAVLGQVG